MQPRMIGLGRMADIGWLWVRRIGNRDEIEYAGRLISMVRDQIGEPAVPREVT